MGQGLTAGRAPALVRRTSSFAITPSCIIPTSSHEGTMDQQQPRVAPVGEAQQPHDGEQPAPDTGFDFDRHRAVAIDGYQRAQKQYADCAEAVYAVLTAALESQKILVHSVERRAKSLASFGDKAAKPSADDPSVPKYADPLREITDLSGVRVITFLLDAVERVGEIIESEFTVLEKINRTNLLYDEEKLGYQSIHYLCLLYTSDAADD